MFGHRPTLFGTGRRCSGIDRRCSGQADDVRASADDVRDRPTMFGHRPTMFGFGFGFGCPSRPPYCHISNSTASISTGQKALCMGIRAECSCHRINASDIKQKKSCRYRYTRYRSAVVQELQTRVTLIKDSCTQCSRWQSYTSAVVQEHCTPSSLLSFVPSL